MLDKLTQLHKSKFFKCFLIAIVLVFSYEVSKPKAFVPLAWAGAVLAGLAAEQLVTMGVKGISKQVLKKQADNYSEQALNAGKFDFLGTNPYRNKDGSISLSPTANDRAKMAGLIAGGLTGMAYGPDGEPLPDAAMACYDEPAKMIGTENTLVTAKRGSGNDSGTLYLYANGVNIAWDGMGKSYFDRFSGYKVKVINVQPDLVNLGDYKVWFYTYGFENGNWVEIPAASRNNASMPGTLNVFKEHGSELCSDGEVAFPSTVQNVYPAPMDMSSAYTMPNSKELSDKPLIIMNVLPAGEEGPITWDEIEGLYDDPETFKGNVNNHIDRGFDNSIINDKPFTVGEINNYYTDINYPVKVIDFNPPKELPPVLPPGTGGGGDGEPVGELDHSMWQVMRNTYNYLDDGIDSSLAAMKGITDSASGITTYLGQTMGWLPAEWRAVFTSAFVLGVFAHFLRR